MSPTSGGRESGAAADELAACLSVDDGTTGTLSVGGSTRCTSVGKSLVS